MSFDPAKHGALYPFASRFMTVGGYRMHYVDEGAGEPVVCLHGNPTWSFHYREIIKALRPSHRVIAPDHVGCGLSDKPGDDRYDYVLERRVRDFSDFIDQLSIAEPLTLVVHDWGGMIGMAYSVEHVERIARLVVLNTAAFFPPRGKRLPWQLRRVRNTRLLGPLAVRGLNAFARLATHMAVVKPLSRAVRAAYVAPYDSWSNRIATLRFVQDIPLRPTDRSYALVMSVERRLTTLSHVPMLVCWGLRDFVFDADYLTEWRRRFPEAEVRALDDAGHYVLEDKSDAIVMLVREFLASHPLPGCRPALSEAAS